MRDCERGQPVTLIARVTADERPVSPGIVTFCDASAPYCEDLAVLGSAAITGNGTASIKKVFDTGGYHIVAVFNGTRTYAGSKSVPEYLGLHRRSRTITTISKSTKGDPSFVEATVVGLGRAPLEGDVSIIQDRCGRRLASARICKSKLNAGFGPLVIYTARPLPDQYHSDDTFSSASADFNGDGLPDLALTVNFHFDDSYGSAVTFFLNDPSHPGQFQQGQTYYLGAGGAFTLVAGDFNSDGVPDLVVSTNSQYSGPAEVLLLGDPAHPGQFTRSILPSAVWFQVAADVNQDGVLDLVGPAGNDIDVLFGDPAHPGQFLGEAKYPAGGGVYSLAAADLNGDGVLDLVVANYNFENSGVSVLLGEPTDPGHFLAPITYPTGAYTDPAMVAIGDFNRDGLPDIATVLYSGGVAIFLNNGEIPGRFLDPREYQVGSSPLHLTLGAFHNDKTLDIVVIDYSNVVYVLPGDPANPGEFLTPINYPLASGNYALGLAVDDFNADGLSDLAAVVVGGPVPFGIGTLLTQGKRTATVSFPHLTYDRAESALAHAHYSGDRNYHGSSSCSIDLSPTGSATPSLSEKGGGAIDGSRLENCRNLSVP